VYAAILGTEWKLGKGESNMPEFNIFEIVNEFVMDLLNWIFNFILGLFPEDED